MTHDPGRAVLGHNSLAARVRFEVKLFNSLAQTVEGGYQGVQLELEAGATISTLLTELRLARSRVFLVFVNGRDITPGLIDDEVRTDYRIQDGDVIALSGPVPYSWGYGSPVV